MRKFNIENDPLEYNFEYNKEETKNLTDDFNQIREWSKKVNSQTIMRVALRKLNRVMNISEDILNELDSLAKDKDIDIESTEIKELINHLVQSQWVGIPLASAILKFIRPDIFPIIDVRAYRAIYGKKIYSSQYTVDKYIEYIKEIYAISKKTGRKIEEIDQQLYEFDKTHNGKI